MKKIKIILGKMGSGKTTLAKELEKRGMKRIVTYTTRPIRPGEIDGVDYHFISPEEFNRMVEEDLFAEYITYNATFGTCSYGSLKEDYFCNEEDKVIVLNPYGLTMVKEKNIPHISIFLDPPATVLQERLLRRGDNAEEIKRRLARDEEDFAGMKADIYIRENIVPEEVADKIEKYVNAIESLSPNF